MVWGPIYAVLSTLTLFSVRFCCAATVLSSVLDSQRAIGRRLRRPARVFGALLLPPSGTLRIWGIWLGIQKTVVPL